MAPATNKTEWKLQELADEAGVSARTVRYYVQRGLLPAPAFKGRDTAYGPEHLLRLKAIKRLQERFLPLDAIQVELARLSADALQALVDGALPGAAVPVPGPRPVVPPAPSPQPRHLSTRWEKWELAPGLELQLSEQADARVRALAERLRIRVETEENDGGAPWTK